ncbi:MAG: FecR domain-containing protein [Chitinophagaceae bacterium]
MKEQFYNITDDLLVKYMIGETTDAENTQVAAWIADSPANQKHFEHFKIIWEESLQLASTSTVDEEAAWQRFKERTTNAPQTATPVVVQMSRWARIAALLVVAVGLGWLSYSLLQRNTTDTALVTIQTQDKVQSDTLPDGSVITSNRQTSISYPSKFTGSERNVQLKGEAFFAVTPNKEKPFIITTGDVTVRVVGTSFNVKNHDSITEVIVETGIVQVTRNNQTITLQQGERVSVNEVNGSMTKEKSVDHLYNYYRSRKFICDGTPLWKLTALLEEVYHVKITIQKPSLRNQPLTTTFENESLDNILSIISGTFNTTVVHNGNEIVLQ